MKHARFLFVVNPLAGGIDKTYFLEKIHDFCQKNGISHRIVITAGVHDKKTLRESLDSYDPDMTIAAGGDGTVNLVAEAIAGTSVALGVIPLGSGNGFSKDLGIPQDIDHALQLLLTGKEIPLDSLTINNKLFVHLADIGFNAKIVKLFSKNRKRGIFTYLKYMVREFFHYKAFKVHVTTDSSHFTGKVFMVIAANLNSYGTNLLINPDGKGNDGIFEIIIIKRFPRIEALSLFFQLLFRKIAFSPYCVVIRGKKALISSSRLTGLQVDGEPAGLVNRVDVKINPGNLKVMVPE